MGGVEEVEGADECEEEVGMIGEKIGEEEEGEMKGCKGLEGAEAEG